MYVESFLLLKEPPQPQPEVRDVALGSLSDGIFVAPEYPVDVRFGVLLELSSPPDEAGEFMIRLVLTGVDVLQTHRVTSENAMVIDRAPVSVAVADDDWETPRSVFRTFEIELEMPEPDVDVLLWAGIDDQLRSYKPLIFRTPPTLPSAL
jgi:hypothetical protein